MWLCAQNIWVSCDFAEIVFLTFEECAKLAANGEMFLLSSKENLFNLFDFRFHFTLAFGVFVGFGDFIEIAFSRFDSFCRPSIFSILSLEKKPIESIWSNRIAQIKQNKKLKMKMKTNSIVQEHVLFRVVFHEQKSSQCLKMKKKTGKTPSSSNSYWAGAEKKNRIKYETKAIGTKQSRTISNVVDHVKTP